MLVSALAYFLSLITSVILGGILSFFVKMLLSVLAIITLLMLGKRNKRQYAINDAPVLTISFGANLFYGYMANLFGIWVFRSLGVPIDYFYILFILFAFVWFDWQRLQSEKLMLDETEENREQLNLRLRGELLIKVNNNSDDDEDDRLNLDKKALLDSIQNSRMTALFGKVAGVVIGGLNLIVRAI